MIKQHLDELLRMHHKEGERFQRQLGEFVKQHTPGIIVETGSGISTIFMLKAMDETGIGRLFSVDPSPVGGYVIEHPRYKIVHKKSFQALASLYQETGPWNLFLHDSDHWVECMTYELDMAYACAAEGGWIMADDHTWDGHDAWKRFVARNVLGSTEFSLGSVQAVQKQWGAPAIQSASELLSSRLWDSAKEHGSAWRTANGRKPCWTCGDEYVESGTNRNA
ncbi:MAG: class SAM-dependent methyltransferase [Bacteroidetes bacterium]|nr:class SAM-dependent methyltransferase [Bacteroidota bacterium]